MPFVPFWADDADSWDVVTLGGFTLPGLSKITGLNASEKIDVKVAPGADGAHVTYKGYNPSEFQIEWRLWTTEQFGGAQLIVPYFRPRPGKRTRKPFDIVHPVTALWGITSVVIKSIKGIDISPDGMGTITFDCVEFLPPPKKNATSSPTAGISEPGEFPDKGPGDKIKPPSATYPTPT